MSKYEGEKFSYMENDFPDCPDCGEDLTLYKSSAECSHCGYYVEYDDVKNQKLN